MDRSHLRRYILSLGIGMHKRRTADSRNQLTLAVTSEEAEKIRKTRAEQGFLSSEKPILSDLGDFYVIRLVPELDSRRIKLGFADDVRCRLAQHRTAAPTAEVVKSWPCKRSWETTVIDCLGRDCRLIANEVFECQDLEKLVRKGDELFSLLNGTPGT